MLCALRRVGKGRGGGVIRDDDINPRLAPKFEKAIKDKNHPRTRNHRTTGFAEKATDDTHGFHDTPATPNFETT